MISSIVLFFRRDCGVGAGPAVELAKVGAELVVAALAGAPAVVEGAVLGWLVVLAADVLTAAAGFEVVVAEPNKAGALAGCDEDGADVDAGLLSPPKSVGADCGAGACDVDEEDPKRLVVGAAAAAVVLAVADWAPVVCVSDFGVPKRLPNALLAVEVVLPGCCWAELAGTDPNRAGAAVVGAEVGAVEVVVGPPNSAGF